MNVQSPQIPNSDLLNVFTIFVFTVSQLYTCGGKQKDQLILSIIIISTYSYSLPST